MSGELQLQAPPPGCGSPTTAPEGCLRQQLAPDLEKLALENCARPPAFLRVDS